MRDLRGSVASDITDTSLYYLPMSHHTLGRLFWLKLLDMAVVAELRGVYESLVKIIVKK